MLPDNFCVECMEPHSAPLLPLRLAGYFVRPYLPPAKQGGTVVQNDGSRASSRRLPAARRERGSRG